MPNVLVAFSPAEDLVLEAEQRFDALPFVEDFDRALSLGDLPAHTAAGLAAQFDVPFLSDFQSFLMGAGDLPQTGLDRDFEFRWDEAKRLGRRVAAQFLGPGTESVTLKGTIYPPQFGTLEDLERLRAQAMNGQPVAFVTGYGSYHGIWCIKSIKDTQTFYFANGYPRKVEFTIELVHYGLDSSEMAAAGNFNDDDTVISNALSTGPGGIGSDSNALNTLPPLGREPDPFET